jgi:hypothetical protein
MRLLEWNPINITIVFINLGNSDTEKTKGRLWQETQEEDGI